MHSIICITQPGLLKILQLEPASGMAYCLVICYNIWQVWIYWTNCVPVSLVGNPDGILSPWFIVGQPNMLWPFWEWICRPKNCFCLFLSLPLWQSFFFFNINIFNNYKIEWCVLYIIIWRYFFSNDITNMVKSLTNSKFSRISIFR